MLKRFSGLLLALLLTLPCFASYSFVGGSRFITGTLTSNYALPVTLALWIKMANHPASFLFAFNFSKDGANNEYVSLLTTSTNDQFWGASYTSAEAREEASYTASAGEYDGVWMPWVVTFGSTTERDIFIELITNTNESTGSNDPSSVLNQVNIGAPPSGSGSWVDFIAEVAIWDVELSDADVTSYLAGNAASGIDASNLIGYWPLDTDRDTEGTVLNEGVDSGGTLTITTATFDADHPTILASGTAAEERRRHMR